MALDTYRSTPNDEEWHRSRLWSRPVALPEEDKSLNLCARHRAMNLRSTDFLDWPVGEELPADTHFGTLTEVISRIDYCAFCRLIADSVSHRNFEEYAEVLGCWICDGMLEGANTTTLRLRIVPEMVGPEDAFAPFDVVPLPSGTRSEMFWGRRVESGQVDLNLLRRWVRSCAEWHGSSCSNLILRTPIDPHKQFSPFIRLLDLKNNHILEITEPPEYVALSYVWGTCPVFKTLQENINQLKCPDGLLSYQHLFPRSIQDAMALTLAIGYRFLWVDSLCIIQDSAEDKGKQLALMDGIYTKALLTIVAAGGEDANAGLSGLGPGSRAISQVTANYSPDLTLVALQPDCYNATEASTWNTRGWTYQERLLSRRILIFANDTVYFQCGRGVWGEDYAAEHPGLLRCAPMTDISLSRSWQPPRMAKRTRYSLNLREMSGDINGPAARSDFTVCCQVIAEYTKRKMSYATDRLVGVDGVLNVIRRASNMPTLYGLSAKMLDDALLWWPQNRLQRVPLEEKGGRPLFPSWSWAGWIGGVYYDAPDDYNGQEPLRKLESRTRPVVDWNNCNLVTTEVRPLGKRSRSPGDTAKDLPERMPQVFAGYGLHLRTRISKFMITLLDRSGQAEDPPGLYRFGISYTNSGGGNKSTLTPVDSNDKPWLGTILLSNRFRQMLMLEYEFIVLSEAYNFSSTELARVASQHLPQWSILNVMLIKRIPSPSFQGNRVNRGSNTESAMLPDGQATPWPEACEVERVGVGRMLKEAWSGVETYEDLMLV